jgi:hypothetical protein
MDGVALGHINFDAGTLDQHIHHLASHRALLADAVSRDLDPGARLQATYDPIFRVTVDHSQRQHGIALSPASGSRLVDLSSPASGSGGSWPMVGGECITAQSRPVKPLFAATT